jgi:hypothetical protein
VNKEERDALREKHRNIDGCCADCVQEYLGWPEYPECEPADYPCDVIKVLDAWEAETELKEIAERVAADTGKRTPLAEVLETFGECEHTETIVETTMVAFGAKPVTVAVTYCPKCGERL